MEAVLGIVIISVIIAVGVLLLRGIERRSLKRRRRL